MNRQSWGQLPDQDSLMIVCMIDHGIEGAAFIKIRGLPLRKLLLMHVAILSRMLTALWSDTLALLWLSEIAEVIPDAAVPCKAGSVRYGKEGL